VRSLCVMPPTGHDPDAPLPESWQNRKLVTAAAWELAADFEKNSDRWENTTVPDYLYALCLLLTRIEHAYANNDKAIPADPWVVIADALKGARYYE
jgi:hypothetical protein